MVNFLVTLIVLICSTMFLEVNGVKCLFTINTK